jgi:hypothetical protein
MDGAALGRQVAGVEAVERHVATVSGQASSTKHWKMVRLP